MFGKFVHRCLTLLVRNFNTCAVPWCHQYEVTGMYNLVYNLISSAAVLFL